MNSRHVAHPSIIRSSWFRTFSQTGHNHVVVCSIIENQDVASKHCGCTQRSERQGVLTRMKLNYESQYVITSNRGCDSSLLGISATSFGARQLYRHLRTYLPPLIK